MIKIEYTDVYGFDAAIRGMRNPLNSWDKSDTVFDGDNEWHVFCDWIESLPYFKEIYLGGEDD